MSDRYDRVEDVSMRLNGTICRWKGTPVSLKHIPGTFNCTAKDLVTEEETVISANSEFLDVSAPELGYVNLEVPVYLYRPTLRQQTMGIHPGNIFCIWPNGKSDKQISWNTFIPLASTILGQYPSFEEAARSSTGLAFARHMAIGIVRGLPLLLYRGDGIGLFEPETKTVRLSPRYNTPRVVAQVSEYMRVESL